MVGIQEVLAFIYYSFIIVIPLVEFFQMTEGKKTLGTLVKDNQDNLIYNSRKIINKQWGVGKFVIFAHFYCVKTPTVANFKLPI